MQSRIWRAGTGLCVAALFSTSAVRGDEGRQDLEAPVQVNFESPLNLIVIEAHIGGEGPFRLSLDSGASGSVIDIDLGRRLGLPLATSRTGPSTAADSQVTYARVRGGVDFTLAPGFDVHLNQVIAAPFTAAGKTMLGESLDGILGAGIFFQYVIEVDYARHVVVFHDPSRYQYDGKGSVLDIEFLPTVSRIPFIRATLVNGDNRLEFPISIDSGGQTMGSASVGTRARWDALVDADSRVVRALGATGLSNDAEGTTHALLFTRMDTLKLGPFEFEHPHVAYSEGGAGFASMGASILHRFTAVFDYARNRLILEPNANTDAASPMDRSGTMLVMSDADDGAFQLWYVAEGTPAHEARLARGDAILAIDGTPSREIRLNDARMMFCRAQAFRLTVRRAGRTFETVLHTRSLFDDGRQESTRQEPEDD